MQYSRKEELVVKLLTGEENSFSEDEWLEIIANDKELSQLYNDYKLLWDNASLPHIEDFNYHNLSSKIDEVSEVSLPKRNTKEAPAKKILLLQKWAAIFIVGLVSISAIFYFMQTHSTNRGLDTYILADNTMVIGHGESHIITDDFTESHRHISLHGQAYFDVATQPASPFTIQTEAFEVTVLGTEFFIDSEKKYITVTEGQVKVTTHTEEILLAAGQKCVIENDGHIRTVPYEITFIQNLNPQLIFDNTPLQSVFKQIALYYDITIEGDVSQYKECRFTSGALNTTSLKDVLDILAMTFNMTYHHSDAGHIYIHSVQCR